MAWKLNLKKGSARARPQAVKYVSAIPKFVPAKRPQTLTEDTLAQVPRGMHRPYDEAVYGTGGGEWGFHASKGQVPKIRLQPDPKLLEKREDRECRPEALKVRDRVDRMFELDQRLLRRQLEPWIFHCAELVVMGQNLPVE
jgi:hypothetical protein